MEISCQTQKKSKIEPQRNRIRSAREATIFIAPKLLAFNDLARTTKLETPQKLLRL
jgi:hypothetical protein